MWSGNKGAKAQEKNEMSTLEKSTIDVLRHLSGDMVHIQLLIYFQEHQDKPIKHHTIHDLINGHSSAYTSHYVRSMLKFGLIQKVMSAFNEQELGYKITSQGIKFYKMYKQIEANLD